MLDSVTVDLNRYLREQDEGTRELEYISKRIKEELKDYDLSDLIFDEMTEEDKQTLQDEIASYLMFG